MLSQRRHPYNTPTNEPSNTCFNTRYSTPSDAPFDTHYNTPTNIRHNTSSLQTQVTVSGTADAVAKATRAIKDMVTKGYSKLIAGEDFQESSVMVRTPRHILSYTSTYTPQIRPLDLA